MKQDQPNTKEKIMNAKHRINDRIARKPGRRHAGLFVLAAILALGFTVSPAQAGTPFVKFRPGVIHAAKLSGQAGKGNGVVTLAIIRIPVKLHHLPGSRYLVFCRLFNKRGLESGLHDQMSRLETIPPSGEINTIEEISLTREYIRHSGRGVVNPLRSGGAKWSCGLEIEGPHRNNLNVPQPNDHQPGTPFRVNVSGKF